MKETIRMKGSQLGRMIGESVRRTIREGYDPKAYDPLRNEEIPMHRVLEIIAQLGWDPAAFRDAYVDQSGREEYLGGYYDQDADEFDEEPWEDPYNAYAKADQTRRDWDDIGERDARTAANLGRERYLNASANRNVQDYLPGEEGWRAMDALADPNGYGASFRASQDGVPQGDPEKNLERIRRMRRAQKG